MMSMLLKKTYLTVILVTLVTALVCYNFLLWQQQSATFTLVQPALARKAPKGDKISTEFEYNLIQALRQFHKASRLERNDLKRKTLQNITKKLQNVNILIKPHGKQIKENITFLFNCDKECSLPTLHGVLRNVSKSYHWKQPIFIAVTSKMKLQLEQFAKVLPSLKFVNVDDCKHLFDTYKKLMEHVETDLIFMTRSITWFPHTTNLKPFADSLLKNTSQVIGSSVVSLVHQWDVGCYQTKTLLYQHSIWKGHDVEMSGNILCDYISGAFMTRKDIFTDFLNTPSSALKVKLMNNLDFVILLPEMFYTSFTFYLDFFHHIQQRHEIVHLKLDTLLGQKSDFENITKDQLRPFLVRKQLSEIRLPDARLFQFPCEEVDIHPGISIKGMFIAKCLIEKLSEVLLFSATIFEKYGYQYELDAGSVVGQAKLSNTLPWERDHDLVYRSRHLKPLLNQSDLFSLREYRLQPKFNDLEDCLKKKKPWKCGYLGIRSKEWRIELWGQHVLSSDVYRADETITDQRLIKTKVLGNVTRGQIGDDWVVTQNNPGAFIRSKYGLDVLKHQQHWSDIGGGTSWIVYKAGKWERCKYPGHHACCDNFLADGNIIFKNVWI